MKSANFFWFCFIKPKSKVGIEDGHEAAYKPSILYSCIPGVNKRCEGWQARFRFPILQYVQVYWIHLLYI